MKNLLRNLVKDKAALHEKSMEDIVAKILEENLLSLNSYMNDIIQRNLYAHQGVEHTVSAVCQFNSGGMAWKANTAIYALSSNSALKTKRITSD